ncbi:hypothetical protein KDA11_06750, partial [Candidatus Saccharibacteria bacterium]|nr:hypothetical protein [Candidatus Saccharibacteria bacterium]
PSLSTAITKTLTCTLYSVAKDDSSKTKKDLELCYRERLAKYSHDFSRHTSYVTKLLEQVMATMRRWAPGKAPQNETALQGAFLEWAVPEDVLSEMDREERARVVIILMTNIIEQVAREILSGTGVSTLIRARESANQSKYNESIQARINYVINCKVNELRTRFETGNVNPPVEYSRGVSLADYNIIAEKYSELAQKYAQLLKTHEETLQQLDKLRRYVKQGEPVAPVQYQPQQQVQQVESDDESEADKKEIVERVLPEEEFGVGNDGSDVEEIDDDGDLFV